MPMLDTQSGTKPTLTSFNDRSKLAIDGWKSSNKKSFSNHNWIMFKIKLQYSISTTIFRCFNRTDCFKFNGVVNIQIASLSTVGALHMSPSEALNTILHLDSILHFITVITASIVV